MVSAARRHIAALLQHTAAPPAVNHDEYQHSLPRCVALAAAYGRAGRQTDGGDKRQNIEQRQK